MPIQTFRNFNPDPLTGLISSLGNLQNNEKAVVQILFQTAKENWTEEINKVFANADFKSVLSNQVSLVREKFSSPLFVVLIRLIVESSSKANSWNILRRIGSGFSQFATPNGNELIALSNDKFSENNHFLSILNRTSYRSGMLLNTSELASLTHLPSNSIKMAKLQRDENRTKRAPDFATCGDIVLGENVHRGESRVIKLADADRMKHLWLTGASGSGKTSLINFLVAQDIKAGNGVTVIEPHSDSIERIISLIPEERLKDVVLFDPADEEFPIAFNPLRAHSELEKTHLASDLAAVLQGFWISQGDIISNVLHNSILAFLESKTGGTLIDLKRFLVDKRFRERFLETVADNELRYYWIHEFPPLSKRITPLLIRLDLFLRSKIIRNILAQKENKLDFRQIIDNRKILLVKLTHGAIGEEHSNLLGAIILSKLYQAALSRQNIPEANRVKHFIYADEAHHFIMPSMPLILSSGRKFGCSLLFSHQETKQVTNRSAELLSSLQTNCLTRICFRTDSDAEFLAKGFSFFTAEHLKNLGVGEAVCRIEQSRYDFNLKTCSHAKIKTETAEQKRKIIVENTRKLYAQPKAEIDCRFTKDEIHRGLNESEVKINISNSNRLELEKLKTERLKKIKDIEDVINLTKNQTTNTHKYLQTIVKRIGENCGFVATLEKQVFGGIGKVDVALENESVKIACEIAVTNTVEYELQNLQKCLTSGFERVVVLSEDEKHLSDIKRKADELISERQLSKVAFLTPDNFHLFLEKLNLEIANQITDRIAKENKVKGYKVNVRYNETSRNEQNAKTQTILDILKVAENRKK